MFPTFSLIYMCLLASQNLKKITALKTPFPDLYTDQGATESNSDPKSFDTKPEGKNKVDNSQKLFMDSHCVRKA